ncbi:MAG: chorismate mutase, partial [Oscillospiraceae bacterium]|nr:chorismate mutase [Oscillospiraceae bacterium]
MKLDELRNEINDIDAQMHQLFLKRMEICKSVAMFKKENNLPIMQEGREQQIIDRVRAASPEHMADASALFFTEVMDISKCLQSEVHTWGK